MKPTCFQKQTRMKIFLNMWVLPINRDRLGDLLD